MTLVETQALLHEAITSGMDLAPELIEACVASTPKLSASDGVEVYANMYLWRLVEALRETFPNLARHLGDETFAGLARDYVRHHPSEHHDVGRLGKALPEFLRRHPDPEQPYLRDLAELEWARNEVFFAPAVNPVRLDAFAGLEPDAFARSRLVLNPAIRILLLEHAVAPLWRQLENGEHPNPPPAGTSPLAVWRSDWNVHHCALPVEEAMALEGAVRGDTLSQVCVAFADHHEPAAAASGAIASWFAEGWVVGLTNADRVER